MTKQVPLRIAKIMYDLQEYCKTKKCCNDCPARGKAEDFYGCVLRVGREPPANWYIERLERESNERL